MVHPTPTCPNCFSNRTRPLDRENAECFDCGNSWIMNEKTKEEVGEYWDQF